MPAPRVYRTDAIVLRQRRLGDADKICVLFAPHHGRIEAVAKGLRRPRSKLAGHLEPLTRAALLLAHGRSLDIITQADTLDAYPHLHDDIDRLSRGLYLAELVDRFTDTAADVGDLYRLLREALARLDLAPGIDLVVRWFEMRLLVDQGYQPRLDRCVHCDTALQPDGNALAPLLGGVCCPTCRVTVPGRPLSATAFKLLRFLQSAPYDDVARVRVDAALGAEIEEHLRGCIHAALDQEVKSAAFVDVVRATRPPAGPPTREAPSAGE